MKVQVAMALVSFGCHSQDTYLSLHKEELAKRLSWRELGAFGFHLPSSGARGIQQQATVIFPLAAMTAKWALVMWLLVMQNQFFNAVIISSSEEIEFIDDCQQVLCI